MSTLCLLEVTKAVDGRGALQKKKLETKAMTIRVNAIPAGCASHCPLSQQKKSCLPIHVAQKITVIRAQKSGKFAV